MRIALIGCQNHWTTYAAVLKDLPEARVVAVALGAPTEKLETFAAAPGVTAETARFDDPRRMLDQIQPDLVNVATALECGGRWNLECARRGVPFATEKPLAFTLDELAQIWEASARQAVPLYPIQGMLGVPAFHAAHEAVKAGRIGKPLASYHQKSYRWGERPDSYKDRRTFPGLVPWVGIHALAWMQWILGDIFEEASGWEGVEARPAYAACASQAGMIFRQAQGGYALLSLDYLRPAAAPTHGDERLRIAGTQGVVEIAGPQSACVLTTSREGPREIQPAAAPLDPYTQFARSLRKEAAPPISRYDAFRVTELAFLAQRAVETGQPVALRPSRFA